MLGEGCVTVGSEGGAGEGIGAVDTGGATEGVEGAGAVPNGFVDVGGDVETGGADAGARVGAGAGAVGAGALTWGRSTSVGVNPVENSPTGGAPVPYGAIIVAASGSSKIASGAAGTGAVVAGASKDGGDMLPGTDGGAIDGRASGLITIVESVGMVGAGAETVGSDGGLGVAENEVGMVGSPNNVCMSAGTLVSAPGLDIEGIVGAGADTGDSEGGAMPPGTGVGADGAGVLGGCVKSNPPGMP
jgi:hypothetical protein